MSGFNLIGDGGVGSAPRVEPISRRAGELLQRDRVIEWPEEPADWLSPSRPADESTVHDSRLEGLRARLGKRMRYVACDPKSEAKGPLLKFAEYINQVIDMRNDLSCAEESMALAHELGHVCLHPTRGNIEDISAADFDQEERILQVVGMRLADMLALGDYCAFATKWGFTHFAPDSLTDEERELAARISEEMLQMIESLQPQAADDYYADQKRSAPVYVRDE